MLCTFIIYFIIVIPSLIQMHVTLHTAHLTYYIHLLSYVCLLWQVHLLGGDIVDSPAGMTEFHSL